MTLCMVFPFFFSIALSSSHSSFCHVRSSFLTFFNLIEATADCVECDPQRDLGQRFSLLGHRLSLVMIDPVVVRVDR